MPELPEVEPGDDVLGAFGVVEPRFLGGRIRKLWRVRQGSVESVLTRNLDSEASLRYEGRALAAVAERGWPVPRWIDGPLWAEDAWWTLAPRLPGRPPGGDDEPRRRGRLLAELHASLDGLPTMGARPGFRRAERMLDDPSVETALRSLEGRRPVESAIVRWHRDRARLRLDGIDLSARPGRLVHGDFATWNLLFEGGRLSGILDFELAHEDHRVAEFHHAWRGKYDPVIFAYDEVLPLEPVEWAILTPLWWLALVDLWARGGPDDGWIVTKLLQRSPLMGPDRDALPPDAKGTF